MMRLTVLCCALAALAGCVVAPHHPRAHHVPHPPGVIVPSGVVYIAPGYAAPAPGYAWRHDHRHGWGWHHERHGWHRGHHHHR